MSECMFVGVGEGFGRKGVDGTEMQFVKDAKATQYNVVA